MPEERDQSVAASDRHRRWSHLFADVIDRVADWQAPTPVPQWRAQDVVAHLLEWFPGFLNGLSNISLSDEPQASLGHRWRRRLSAVQRILDDADTAARLVSSGPFAGATLGAVIDRAYTADVFMHSWDLARSAGVPVELDGAYAAGLRAELARHEPVLRRSGHYGPAFPHDGHDPVDRLMAFVGRDPSWRSPAPRRSGPPVAPAGSERLGQRGS